MGGDGEQHRDLFSRGVRKISMISAVTGAFCVFFLMIWGMAGIVGRFFFDYEMPGQYEASGLLLVLSVYLSLAYTQFEGSHIRMNILILRISGRKREYVEAFNLILCIVPTVILLWATGKEALSSYIDKEFQMGIYSFPEWPSKVALPIGLLLFALCVISQIWSHVKASRLSE